MILFFGGGGGGRLRLLGFEREGGRRRWKSSQIVRRWSWIWFMCGAFDSCCHEYVRRKAFGLKIKERKRSGYDAVTD